MKITNAALSVPRNDSRLWLDRLAAELSGPLRVRRYPLRNAITAITEREAIVESTFVDIDSKSSYAKHFTEVELSFARRIVA